MVYIYIVYIYIILYIYILYIYIVYIYILYTYYIYIHSILSMYKLYKLTPHSIHTQFSSSKSYHPGRGVDGIPEETKARQLLSDDARVDLPGVDAHLELLLQESDGNIFGNIMGM